MTEAKNLVHSLKQKAAQQSSELAEKQSEADAALQDITASMQVSRPLVSNNLDCAAICDDYNIFLYFTFWI